MPLKCQIAHVHNGRTQVLRRLPFVLLAGVLLWVAGCGDSPPPPPPPPAPPPGAEGTPAAAGPSAGSRPASELPPVAWVELTQPPEVEARPFTAAELAAHRMVVVAVPVAGFPSLMQGEREYRQALLQDWRLNPTLGADDPTADPAAVVCQAAVAGLQGQFSLATQTDPTTHQNYLRSATVSGSAEAIHLVFLLPRGAAPFTILYRDKPVYVCAPQADAALINRLFLPKRAPNRWQAARVDLSEQPLAVKDFGACVEIRRENFILRQGQEGAAATLKPAAGKVFFSFRFAPVTAGFDFHLADWRLVLADSSGLAPFGVSANGGQDYLLGVQDATDFRGGASTSPVVLFEAPATATLLKLQHRTQVILLPQ